METAISTTGQLALTGQKTYDSHIKQFTRWLEGRPVTADSIKEFLTEREKTRAPATVANTKAALKKSVVAGVFDMRVKAAIDAAFKEIKSPRPDTKIYKEEILTDSDIYNLKENSPEWLALIVETLALTGMRISELIKIRLPDCKREGSTVFIKITGKGKKERRVFLPVQLFDKINNSFKGGTHLFENRAGKQYCRKFIWREINKHGWRTLDRDIHPHLFRHSFATRQIQKKGSVKAVSQYLGHTSTAITETMYHHDQLSPEDIY